jgi:putative membrane protein insertion efficiency factor
MKQVMQFVLRCYQRVISPMLPHACRFVPTCSQYAIEAVECHGAIRGSVLAAGRLLRCHPFARAGFDPVPSTMAKPGYESRDGMPVSPRTVNGT